MIDVVSYSVFALACLFYLSFVLSVITFLSLYGKKVLDGIADKINERMERAIVKLVVWLERHTAPYPCSYDDLELVAVKKFEPSNDALVDQCPPPDSMNDEELKETALKFCAAMDAATRHAA